MTTIHHATANRASKLGIDLTADVEGKVIARWKGRILAEGTNARLVLDEAISEQHEIKSSKMKSKAKARKDDEGDDEEGDDEEGERGGFIKSKYREEYRKHEDSCGDDLAQFLGSEFKDKDGKFMPAEFIAFVEENGIEPGEFRAITRKSGDLPHGLMGRARMTLRNRLASLVRKNGHLIYNGRKKTFSL